MGYVKKIVDLGVTSTTIFPETYLVNKREDSFKFRNFSVILPPALTNMLQSTKYRSRLLEPATHLKVALDEFNSVMLPMKKEHRFPKREQPKVDFSNREFVYGLDKSPSKQYHCDFFIKDLRYYYRNNSNLKVSIMTEAIDDEVNVLGGSNVIFTLSGRVELTEDLVIEDIEISDIRMGFTI